MGNEFLFVEKYRPQDIDSCILPSSIKKSFKEFVENGEVPNMMLTGGPGVGKTTIAKALCNELDMDCMMINGSEEGNIDTLRTKIKQFASTVSLTDSKKVVILDEADYLNSQSTQPALRGFMEEFSDNCRFILTCNFKNRIIKPLHSRCTTIDFNIPSEERSKLAAQFMKRLVMILEKENINYDKKVLVALIKKDFPDFRKIINEIQRYGASGNIDSGILVSISDESFEELIKYLKEKDFTNMRKWVALNIDKGASYIIRWFYDNSLEHVEPNSVPQLIYNLGQYQEKEAFVADSEINVACMFTEIMSEVNFK